MRRTFAIWRSARYGMFLVAGYAAFGIAPSLAMKLHVIPPQPRYLEPVYVTVQPDAFSSYILDYAEASMNGTTISVRLNFTVDCCERPITLMLGRFPTGNYNIVIPQFPGVSTSFSVAPSAPNPNVWSPSWPTINYSDLWWDPAEPGWGLNIAQGPGNEVIATWFTYDDGGRPTWYSLQAGRWTSRNAYAGTVYRTAGQKAGGLGATGTIVPVGTGLLTFDTPTSGVFIFEMEGLNSRKPIRRQPVE
jgi:hypothetical protein